MGRACLGQSSVTNDMKKDCPQMFYGHGDNFEKILSGKWGIRYNHADSDNSNDKARSANSELYKDCQPVKSFATVTGMDG